MVAGHTGPSGGVVPKRMSLVQFVAIDLIKHWRFMCFMLRFAENFCQKALSDILLGTTHTKNFTLLKRIFQ